VADVQISASLSHVPPPAELIVIVQCLNEIHVPQPLCLVKISSYESEYVWPQLHVT